MAGSFELSDSLDQARTLSVSVPTGGVTEGEVIQTSDVLTFVLATVEFPSTATNNLDQDEYTAVVQARKVTANKDSNAISQGASVFWDGTNATASSTGNDRIGYALEAALASDSTVEIYFDGNLRNV